ncbi:MAG: TSUP family transporter, partial [Desulfovibrio sp.]|nr:TSUP family transporter [Desulfovibrio sp.]
FILGLNLIAATGTAKVFNLASNISSLFVFLLNGKVYFFVAVPMALANMTGNILGSRMALRGGPKIVRRMLLFSLSLLFVSLIWRYYN